MCFGFAPVLAGQIESAAWSVDASGGSALEFWVCTEIGWDYVLFVCCDIEFWVCTGNKSSISPRLLDLDIVSLNEFRGS
jgi:hypothetical protein